MISRNARVGRWDWSIDRRGVLRSGAALLSAAAIPQAMADEIKRYHSDYFSFVGSDAAGTVYLAHDNNRGQTGDKFFADHWIFMFAEGDGVVPLSGSAHYPNTEKVLEYIPDSADFQFRGRLADGMRMASASNGMQLDVSALQPILRRQTPGDDYWIGAAPATLQWKDRTLRGRVIFEFIARTGFNRFTSDFGANWNNFNGLYLATEDGRDVYLRHHEKLQPGTPRDSGMATIEGEDVLADIAFRVLESRAVADRPYRWPVAWDIEFACAGSRWRLQVTTAALEEVADWKTGGFAMSVVRGTIAKADGTGRRSVKGLAELLI